MLLYIYIIPGILSHQSAQDDRLRGLRGDGAQGPGGGANDDSGGEVQRNIRAGTERQTRVVLSPQSPPFVPKAAAACVSAEPTPASSPSPPSPSHPPATSSAFASRSSIFGSGPGSSSSSSHTQTHDHGHKTKWTRDRHGILRPELHLNTDVRQDLRLGDSQSQSQSPSRSSPSAGTKLPSFYRQFIQASPPKPSVQVKGPSSPPPPPTSATSSMKMPVIVVPGGAGMPVSAHPSFPHPQSALPGPVSWRAPSGHMHQPQMQMPQMPQMGMPMQMYGAGSGAVFVAPDCPLAGMGPMPGSASSAGGPGGGSSNAAAVAAAILRPSAAALLGPPLPLPPQPSPLRHLDPHVQQMARPHSAPGLSPAVLGPGLVHPHPGVHTPSQVTVHPRDGAIVLGPALQVQGGRTGTPSGKPVFANQASLAARSAALSTRTEGPVSVGPAPALTPSPSKAGKEEKVKASAPDGAPVMTLGTAERWPTLDEICARKGP